MQITSDVRIPASELEFRVSRSGGPGGQGVNTTDSQVELRFDLEASEQLTPRQKELARKRLSGRITREGVLVIRSSEHRSQHRNRKAAVARLRALLGEAITPPKPRKATRPSRSARRRRLENKRRRAEIKRLRRSPEPPPDR